MEENLIKKWESLIISNDFLFWQDNEPSGAVPEAAGTDFPSYGNRPYRVSGAAEVH